jgi:hypothetical protein
METFNKFAVGVIGTDVAIMMPPRRLTPDEAMMFAAWIVTMAQIQDAKLPAFVQYVNAVQAT